jgi:hypothetical protein
VRLIRERGDAATKILVFSEFQPTLSVATRALQLDLPAQRCGEIADGGASLKPALTAFREGKVAVLLLPVHRAGAVSGVVGEWAGLPSSRE